MLCLNVLVKNNADTIERLLKSTIPIINSCCVCDMGCTDNTISIIQHFFKQYPQIQIFVYNCINQDIEYIRNKILKQCRNKYVLLLDATMELIMHSVLEFQKLLDKHILEHPLAIVQQNADGTNTTNTRIIFNDGNFVYEGKPCEYISTAVSSVIISSTIATIINHDVKCLSQLSLLEQQITLHPQNSRYWFYYANALVEQQKTETTRALLCNATGRSELTQSANREASAPARAVIETSSRFLKAIESYKKRIALGGWNQEIWYCYYQLGKLATDPAQSIYYWLEAYNIIPERIENLYEIVNHYRTKPILAKPFLELAITILNAKHNYDATLYYKRDIYEWKMKYEYLTTPIMGFNTDLFMDLCNCKTAPDDIWNFYPNTALVPKQAVQIPHNGDVTSACILPCDDTTTNTSYLYNICTDNACVSNIYCLRMSSDFQVLEQVKLVSQHDIKLTNVHLFYNFNQDVLFIETTKMLVGAYEQTLHARNTGYSCNNQAVVLSPTQIITNWYPFTVCDMYTGKLDYTAQMPAFFRFVEHSTSVCVFSGENWFVVRVGNFHAFIKIANGQIQYSAPFMFDDVLRTMCDGLVVESNQIICTCVTNEPKLFIYEKPTLNYTFPFKAVEIPWVTVVTPNPDALDAFNNGTIMVTSNSNRDHNKYEFMAKIASKATTNLLVWCENDVEFCRIKEALKQWKYDKNILIMGGKQPYPRLFEETKSEHLNSDFIVGSRERFAELYQLYTIHYPEYVKKYKETWDVNFLSALKTLGILKMEWYCRTE